MTSQNNPVHDKGEDHFCWRLSWTAMMRCVRPPIGIGGAWRVSCEKRGAGRWQPN